MNSPCIRTLIFTIFFGLLAPAFTARAAEPLTLDHALQIARENSLQQRMARTDVAVAQDQVARALAEFGPDLNLETGIYRYNEPPSLVQMNQGLVRLNNALSALTSGRVPAQDGPDDSRTYYGYGVRVTQPLYTGNKLTAGKHLARANLDKAREGLTVSGNDLILAVKKAFFTTLLARQTATAMDEAVDSMTRHVKEAQAYHKMDTVPKLDLLRAREKLADLTQQRLYAKNNFTLAKTTLNYVMGVDMARSFSLQAPAGYPQLPDNLEACVQKAMDSRPEIAAMDAKIAMAKAQITLEKSGRLPTVALVAGAHHYEPENEEPAAQIGVVARMNIYDNGRVKHRIARARHQLEKAKTGKKQLTRAIRLEVEKAFRNAQAARASIDVAQKSLATAKEVLDAARTRYRVGLSTSLERLDAEVSLTRARTNTIQATSMYNIAVSELERAIGKEQTP